MQNGTGSTALAVRSGAASAAASTHTIVDAAALIERELDHDERRDATIDQIRTGENGLYTFESRRLKLRRTVPIPQAIIDQYDQLECKSFVGLFPEISRAFITIDNKLFLWNYHDGSDFLLYDELSQIILSVSLMRPRRGVFVAAIPYVLVVATPVEVLLFAVKFERDNVHQPLQLFPTQFTIPSDGVHMTNSVGTEEGRVLLAGKDGGIYELDYSNDGGAQGAGSWAGLWSSQSRKKCRKLNHSAPRFRLIRSLLPTLLGGLPSPLAVAADGAAAHADPQVSCMVYDRTRNLIFTLSSVAGIGGGGGGSGAGSAARNLLQCFSLGASGWELTLRSKNESIGAEVRNTLLHSNVPTGQWEDLGGGGAGQQSDVNLVALFPVPRHESASVVLLAVTSHGHRIYFDLGESGVGALRVRFVRLCPPAVSPDELNRGAGALAGARSSSLRVEPGFSKATSPSLVHAAYYKDGMLLLADAGRSALGDTLVAIQREMYAGTSGVGVGVGVGAGAYNNAALRSWGAPAPVGSVASNKLLESIDAFDLESRIAELGEVHESAQLNLLSSALYSRSAAAAAATAAASGTGSSAAPPQPLQGLSELATQHVTPNRHFLILTSSSLLTLSASRPLDDLRVALLALRRTNDEAPLVALYNKYGAKETAAMCLTLVGAHFVSGDSLGAGALDQVEQRSTPSTGGTGGQQMLSIASPNKLAGSVAGGMGSSGGVSDEAMRRLAKQAFFRVADMHMHAQMVASASLAAAAGVAGAGSAGVATGNLSCKLEAIALYMSRWLRSHWDWSLCIPASSASAAATAAAGSAPSSAFLTFRFSKEYYLQLLQPLLKLQRFMQENQRVLMRDVGAGTGAGAAGSMLNQSAAPHQMPMQVHGGSLVQSGLADPGRMEVESLSNLSSLLGLTIEIFHLMVLFLSYSGSGTSSSSGPGAAAALLHSSPFLSPVDLQRLREFKLIDVLTSGEGHALVSKMINTLAQVGAVANERGARAVAGLGLSPLRGKRSRDDMSDEYGNGVGGFNGASSASSLISQLHSACPTFFGQSDLLYCNALESLSRARAAWNMEGERERHLSQAVDTLASFLHAPSFPLEEAAAKLKQLHQYESIVSLALQRAELLERREVVRPRSDGVGTPFGSLAGAGASDEDFYAGQKKRCILVLLDTLSVLILGVGAGGKNIANSSNSGSATGGASASANGTNSSLSRAESSEAASSVPPLSSEALSGVRDRVLAQVLSSRDPSIHAALYAWYIDKGLLEQLYSVRNEHVVRFLLSRDEFVLVLKDYYLRNQRWWEAAMLLRYLALTKSDQYTLHQRVEFLTRSLGCARSFQQQQQLQGSFTPMRTTQRAALGPGAGTGAGAAASTPAVSGSDLQDTIDQLNDRADIAKIQLDIYGHLQTMLQSVSASIGSVDPNDSSRSSELSSLQSRRDSLSEALAQLSHELLDIQSLYLLCTSFGLWEICLHIFYFSGERARSDVIQALWKNILRAQMAQCKRMGIDWAPAVQAKLVELASGPATNYRTIDFLFPLPFLLRELEHYNFAFRARPDEHFVADCMVAAGVPVARLLQAYEELVDGWEQNADAHQLDAIQPNAQGQTIHTFLFFSIWNLLRHTVDEQRAAAAAAGRSAGAGRRAFAPSAGAASASHLFNKCITNLRTLPPSTDTTRLAAQFQSLYQEFLQSTR